MKYKRNVQIFQNHRRHQGPLQEDGPVQDQVPSSGRPSQLRVAAFDVRGGISTGTYAYFQEIIARESASKPSTPKSVIANRVYSRFSVSVQRSIANNIMEFRYGQVPAQLVVGAGA